MAVDLHIHSTASDGSLTPAEILAEARRVGLSAAAIADHDEVRGTQEIVALTEGAETLAIPAVEISTDYRQTEVHILGYWVDLTDDVLLGELHHIRDGRVQRAAKIVKRLAEIDVDISLEDVLRQADGASVGRPHVARALIHAGVCATPHEAFGRYLGRKAPAYIPRVRPSTEEAIALVTRAGGCPVLAHPGLVRGQPRAVFDMKELGVAGVEVYHPKHGRGQIKTFLSQAERAGLLVTGGSDSHGPRGTHPVEIGDGDAPDSCAEALLRWRNNNR